MLLVIRPSWVRARPAPHSLTCGNVRFGPAGQHAYRMDAGVVAAMTPAERFAERRKRRQKPWLAKLEPVRPGPVARHSSLTRYPGPKPPPFARRGADGHGRCRVRGIPQPERLSTRHLRGAAPTADARPHATARQAPIPPPAPHHKPCGSRVGTGHNLTKRGCVPASPPPTRLGWCHRGRPARSDRIAPPGRLNSPVPVGRGALRVRPRGAADRARRPLPHGAPGRGRGGPGERRPAWLDLVAVRPVRALRGRGGPRRRPAGRRALLPAGPARRLRPGDTRAGDRLRPRRDSYRGHAPRRRPAPRTRRGRRRRRAGYPAPPRGDVPGPPARRHRADGRDGEPARGARPGRVHGAAGQPLPRSTGAPLSAPEGSKAKNVVIDLALGGLGAVVKHAPRFPGRDAAAAPAGSG